MYKIKFDGYASIFNTKDYVNDVILPCSFTKKDNINLLYEHDSNKKIGFVTNIYQNELGLYVEGVIDKTDENIISMVFGDTQCGLSIGYIAKKYHYDKEVRIITEIELLEISLVSHPANKHCCIKYKELF